LLADNFLLVIAIILIGILAITCLFLYKNRKLQFKLSVLGIFASFGFLFLEYFKVEAFKTVNQFISGSYQIGALLPLLMVIFFFLAAKGIYKDEKLIKSVDRLGSYFPMSNSYVRRTLLFISGLLVTFTRAVNFPFS